MGTNIRLGAWGADFDNFFDVAAPSGASFQGRVPEQG